MTPSGTRLPSLDPKRPVGFFDSGVGGFSVLRRLRSQHPSLGITYLADNRHLPYGDKSAAWLVGRCTQLTEALLGRGADLVVVACNTATTHAIATLRVRFSQVAFVGVEPGIRPAARLSRNRCIAVMATEATLRSERLRSLAKDYADGSLVVPIACTGLADAIERGDTLPLDELIAKACDEIVRAGADTVVLGCTHYPLVADRLARRLGPGIELIDTGEAICRRIAALAGLDSAALDTSAGDGTLALLATGDALSVARSARQWLDADATVESVALPLEPSRFGSAA